MRPSSQNRKPISRKRARNAALINQLVTPGFGSLMCGRWVAGTGQVILAFAGCTLVIIWFVRLMAQYYGLMFNDAQSPGHAPTRLMEAGVGLMVAAWLWSGITSLSLDREAADEKLDELKRFAAPPPLKLDTEKIGAALVSVREWKRTGDVISRTYQFKDFPAAIKFVAAVADLAESAWHHPDIDIRWNKVTLSLTTHDAGGLTEMDFALAKKFDGVATL